VNVFLDFLREGANWTGSDGIPQRILEHLQYTFLALALVVLIGLPLGLYVGHTGRGAVAIAGTANSLRALPDFGLLVYVVLLVSGSLPAQLAYLLPSILVLVVLGVPAVLSATYAGVQNVDPAARDAAEGMGMTGSQVLWRVEVPNALPLILGGLRTATLQIVATATVAAYASLGGLGRYLIDGIKVREFHIALVGALMVTALALILDAALAFAVWASVPGSDRLQRLRGMPQPLLGDEVALESGSLVKTTSNARYERGDPSPTVEG
jgi:osmoprotectant transport system permease protein